MRAKRFRGIKIGLPLRRRTASGPVTASAGMPSSAVEIGLKCSKAAGLCIKPLSGSRGTESFSAKPPTEVRRSWETWPTVPTPRGETRDVSAFSTTHFEHGMVLIGHLDKPGFLDLDKAGLEFHDLAIPGQIIGP